MLLLLAAIPAAAAGLWHPRAPAWSKPMPVPTAAPASGEVTLATIEAWQPDVLWVDARAREAYEQGHVPGAHSLNEDAWDEGLAAVLGAWTPGEKVVVYCDGGSCDASHAVAARLREEAGLSEVYVLHGGWAALRETQR